MCSRTNDPAALTIIDNKVELRRADDCVKSLRPITQFYSTITVCTSYNGLQGVHKWSVHVGPLGEPGTTVG